MKKVAVFGAGRIGRIHAANIAALAGVQLAYVCDPIGDSAAQLAGQLGAQVSTIESDGTAAEKHFVDQRRVRFHHQNSFFFSSPITTTSKIQKKNATTIFIHNAATIHNRRKSSHHTFLIQ